MSLNLKDFLGKNIHIIGVSGMEGLAVFRFLSKYNISAILHDFSSNLDELKQSLWVYHDYLSNQEKQKIWHDILDEKRNLQLKDKYLKDIKKADLIFVPQSWFRYPINEPLKKLQGEIQFLQLTDLYFKFFPGTIIGVTGSSGKSTTSALIYHLIKDIKGRKVWLSGNDRANPPVLEKIEEANKNDILILEISNRQLIGLRYSPNIAVVTTISPTHIDDHSTFSEYVNIKKNIVRYQKPFDLAILNKDNEFVKEFANFTKADVLWFGTLKRGFRGAFLDSENLVFNLDKKEKIIKKSELKIPGIHNVLNALASSLVAKKLGLKTEEIASKLKTFKGLKHRLELVGEINGVEFYNDSQATNPEAAEAAIEAFNKPKIIIAGGKSKPNAEDFREWLDSMWDSNVKALFLIGEAQNQIYEVYKEILEEREKSDFIIKKCNNLDRAFKETIKLVKRGDVVLLSPACESFGEFRDYRERGERFKELVSKYFRNKA